MIICNPPYSHIHFFSLNVPSGAKNDAGDVKYDHLLPLHKRQCLVTIIFTNLHRPSDKWPSTKDPQFWKSAANVKGKGRVKRSGENMLIFFSRTSMQNKSYI